MKGSMIKGLIKTILSTVLASFVVFEILGDVDLKLTTFRGYIILAVLMIVVVGLLVLYCYHFGRDVQIISFFVMLATSGLIVFLVGWAFIIPLNNIIVAWFVSLPSVLLLDRLMK